MLSLSVCFKFCIFISSLVNLCEMWLNAEMTVGKFWSFQTAPMESPSGGRLGSVFNSGGSGGGGGVSASGMGPKSGSWVTSSNSKSSQKGLERGKSQGRGHGGGSGVARRPFLKAQSVAGCSDNPAAQLLHNSTTSTQAVMTNFKFPSQTGADRQLLCCSFALFFYSV